MPKFSEPADAEVQRAWLKFWAPILIPHFLQEGLAGEVDMEQVKRELFDYRNIMREASKVYEAIANLSKPNTAAIYVIAAHEEACNDAYHDGWADCKKHFGIGQDDVQDCTREQPHDGPCNGWPCAYVKSLPCPRGCGQTIGVCLTDDCGQTG